MILFKESSIKKIVHNLLSTISKNTVKIIIILDGCIDKTLENIQCYLKKNKPIIKKDLTIHGLLKVIETNN